MNIVFIVPCYEPGRDGVGDYTRRLVEQLQHIAPKNIKCGVIAWNDSFVKEPSENTQVLRLPSSASEDKKLTIAERFLGEFAPDCFSLQWVPFGYHPKGLVSSQIESLQRLISLQPLHLMIHELWVGAKKESTLKERALGIAQKHLFRKLIKKLKPAWIHTQAKAYQHLLSEIGVQASILPLFSNISVCTQRNRSDRAIHAGFFGAIHPETRLDSLIPPFLELGETHSSSLSIEHAGRLSESGADLFQSWKQQWGDHIQFQRRGELTPAEVSAYLSSLHFGLSTNPLALLDKSGSVAAMFEHNLPVINLRDDVHFKNFSPQFDKNWVLHQPDASILESFLESDPGENHTPSIETIASTLFHTLKDISK